MRKQTLTSHHFSQGVLIALIPLNLSRHPSLSPVELSRSLEGIHWTLRADIFNSWVPQQNAAYEFVFVSRDVSRSSVLDVTREIIGRIAAVFCHVPFSICPKQHAKYLCRSNLAFSPGVSLHSRGCSRTIVLARI